MPEPTNTFKVRITFDDGGSCCIESRKDKKLTRDEVLDALQRFISRIRDEKETT